MKVLQLFLSILFCVCCVACGGGRTVGERPSTSTPRYTGPALVYVLNSDTSNITGFRVATSGDFVQIAGSPFQTELGPGAMAAASNLLVVGSQGNAWGPVEEHKITTYRVSEDGQLHRLAVTKLVDFGIKETVSSLALDPNARFLYVGLPDQLAVFSIDSSGQLTLTSAAEPFLGNYNLNVSKDGNRLCGEGIVEINTLITCGTRDPAAGTIFDARRTGFADLGGISISPDSQFLGVSQENQVSVWKLMDDNGVSRVTPNVPTAGMDPIREPVFDTSGKFLFIANGFTANVSSFTFNAGSQTLLPNGRPVPTGGTRPFQTAIVPDRFVIVSDIEKNFLSVFAYDDSGVLTPHSKPTLATDGRPIGMVVLVP